MLRRETHELMVPFDTGYSGNRVWSHCLTAFKTNFYWTMLLKSLGSWLLMATGKDPRSGEFSLLRFGKELGYSVRWTERLRRWLDILYNLSASTSSMIHSNWVLLGLYQRFRITYSRFEYTFASIRFSLFGNCITKLRIVLFRILVLWFCFIFPILVNPFWTLFC